MAGGVYLSSWKDGIDKSVSVTTIVFIGIVYEIRAEVFRDRESERLAMSVRPLVPASVDRVSGVPACAPQAVREYNQVVT